MPLLGFKKQFVPKVKAGLRRKPGGKRQTIRKQRKRPFKRGDILILAEGVRTKQYRELGRAECTEASRIEIRASETGDIMAQLIPTVYVEGKALDDREAHLLAVADGFKCWGDFIAFFQGQHGLPFRGQLIKW